MMELLGFYQADKPNRIQDTAVELEAIYREKFPYIYIPTLTGDCLQWDETFIDRVLYALATDDMTSLSDTERQIWREFVEYEDRRTHSANTDSGVVDPIGCTIPDKFGRSYTVTANGITGVLCDSPLSKVSKENISHSLDQVFMDIYNCSPYNDCGLKQGDLIDISPCPLNLTLVG